MPGYLPIDPSRPDLVRLCDYRPPAWRIDTLELEFDLDPRDTQVLARLALKRDPQQVEPLRLDGTGLRLLSIALDGVALSAEEYAVDAEGLTVPGARDGSVLETRVGLCPQNNSSLSGLYTSTNAGRSVLLTQCEAEGFRRITYFPDRPDLLSRYSVTLRARHDTYPLLLSNGNPVASGLLDDGRHWARWEDPFPKPSYLFALVAGDLAFIEDQHRTADGRLVSLRIYADEAVIARCAYAMDALKRAMVWDEIHYGRNYDLDLFQIVATDDFNMGAMENKGLNIFNAKYLLADPQHSSDEDYAHVEAIVAHEYFHNWTGNRVTCRDWFQLCLKEGLTVFREQQFSADSGSATLRRIEQVQVLRRGQFPEDAGPLAHPVRPEHYVAIDNFYTATVYDKGAELVRMLAVRLGPLAWRAGMDEYFRRHDGQAATVEQFLAALGAPTEADLGGYLAWYEQAGTPLLDLEGDYNAAQRIFRLSLSQRTDPTPGQPHKYPVPIPVRLALLGADGSALPLHLVDANASAADECVLELTQSRQTWIFHHLDEPRAVSALRGFSAPVRLHNRADAEELAFLLRHEQDGFNRWDASQQLARLAFDEVLGALTSHNEAYAEASLIGNNEIVAAGPVCRIWCDALAALFDTPGLDPALLAELLTPPDLLELAERCSPLDPPLTYAARLALDASLARRIGAAVAARHADLLRQESGAIDGAAQNRRRLLGRCLHLAAFVDSPAVMRRALARCADAPSMSERLVAMSVLCRHDIVQAEVALADFEQRHCGDAVSLDKWFSLQAQIPRADSVERVAGLLEHPAFSLHKPNRVYALLRTFAVRNTLAFHRIDGAGYRLVEDQLRQLDAINPQVAARVATIFKDLHTLEPVRRGLLDGCLRRLQSTPNLSRDLADILQRSHIA